MLKGASPLSETLQHLSSLNRGLAADVGPLTSNFFPVVDLLLSAKIVLHQMLTSEMENTSWAVLYPRTSRLIGDYIWVVTAGALGAYLLDQRIPDLTPENMALCLNGHGDPAHIGVRFLSGRFGCLPCDSYASHPDATVLVDAPALIAWMRDQLAIHVSLLVEDVIRITDLTHDCQHRLIMDACARRLHYLGETPKNDDAL